MKILISTLGILLVASGLQAQDRVVAHTKRMNLLKSAQELIDVSDESLFEKLSDVRYPFEFEPQKTVVVADNTNKEKIVAPPPPPPKPVTKKEALDEFVSRLRPTGVLFKEDRGVLILAGGKQLLEGKVYRVNYKGKPFDIEVTEVTTDSYTLSIDDVTVTSPFDESSGTGIKRD